MMEVLDIMEVDLGLDTAWVVVVVDEEKVLVTAALDWLHYESIEWIKRPIDSIVRLYWLSNMLYMNSYKWLLNLVCKP